MLNLTTIKSSEFGSALTNVSPSDASQWHAVFGGSTTSSGITVNHKTTIGYPPFWRGVNLLANSVSGLPVDIFRRVGANSEVASDHPAQTLIKRNASPIMRARKLRKTLLSHALLFGNGFAWIERAGVRPMALWLLDPQSVIVRYVDGELWYSTTISGQQARFPGRDVIHITGLTHNGITGYSAVDIFAEALGVGMAAQRFGSQFFGSGANMSGLLMVPGHFNEEKIRNTLAAWGEMAQGLSNAHKVALLQDGVKFQPFTVAPDNAQFLETRNFEVRAVVASILGVPPHLLGDDSRTSHSSLEQENQSYLNHSLNPWLNEFEGELEAKLLTEQEQETGSHFVEFNREAAVQMLFTQKVDGIYRQVEMGMLTINEGRKLINLAGIGADGDKRYRPANWMEVTTPEPAEGITTTETETEAERAKAIAEIVQKVYLGVGVVLTSEEARQLVSESGFSLPGDLPEQPAEPAAMPQSEDMDEDMSEDMSEDMGEEILRQMIESNVTDSLAFERRKVITAAKKEPNFCAWIDTFYERWACESVVGMQTPKAIEVKSHHAAESKRQLLDVAGSSTTTTLPGNVAELVATWDGRTQKLVTQLLETVKCR